ncbi:MAG TPA: HDOD domain-containing protein [Desulfuromonadales bacterium]|nr:HDOD domain-containing protein [Desulfuromonadales bacterium]
MERVSDAALGMGGARPAFTLLNRYDPLTFELDAKRGAVKHSVNRPTDVFIGRQPIYDRSLQIFAYELLYRCSEEKNYAEIVDGDLASAEVLVNAILEIGLDNIVGPHKAFFNFTRQVLLEKREFPLAVDQLVVEVLETVEPDAAVVDAVTALAKRGHTIALDDFVFREELKPLLDAADIVKLDVLALSRAQLVQHVEMLRSFPVKLLAEKVETLSDYEYCRDLGFDYFQGYFLSRPNIMYEKTIPANRLAALNLIAQLQEPGVELEDLERIISSDVTLSLKLLRSVNSVFYGLYKEVSSIRQAILYLGMRFIRNWATVLAMARLDDKPTALMTTALVRAKMCSSLHSSSDSEHEGLFFIVGLFSVLDALMDMPLSDILERLPLSQEVSAALLSHDGAAGRGLACTLAYEQGDWASVMESEFGNQATRNAYLSAIFWADQTMVELGLERPTGPRS